MRGGKGGGKGGGTRALSRTKILGCGERMGRHAGGARGARRHAGRAAGRHGLVRAAHGRRVQLKPPRVTPDWQAIKSIGAPRWTGEACPRAKLAALLASDKHPRTLCGTPPHPCVCLPPERAQAGTEGRPLASTSWGAAGEGGRGDVAGVTQAGVPAGALRAARSCGVHAERSPAPTQPPTRAEGGDKRRGHCT